MKMPINLNFRPRHLSYVALDLSVQSRKASIKSVVVLFLTSVLLIVAGLDYINVTNQFSIINKAANPARELNDTKLRYKSSPEEVGAIQKEVNELTIPWGILFTAMEAIHSDKVVLISLEPSAEKKNVRIVAEVSDVYQMLDYVRAFSAQPGIYKVHLVNQKTTDNQQEQIIRFILEGYWGKP